MATRFRNSLLFGAALALLLVFPGLSLLRKYADRKLPNFRKETHLYVYPDTPLSEVVAFVRDSCGARRPKSVERVFAQEKPHLKPGHYVVPAAAPSVYVTRMLQHGWQTPVPLVLSGTMRLKGAIARKIANQLLLDSASMHAALCDRELLASFGFTRRQRRKRSWQRRKRRGMLSGPMSAAPWPRTGA